MSLGDGDVDWRAVRRVFGEIGFSGSATVELDPAMKPISAMSATALTAPLRPPLTAVRQCNWHCTDTGKA